MRSAVTSDRHPHWVSGCSPRHCAITRKGTSIKNFVQKNINLQSFPNLMDLSTQNPFLIYLGATLFKPRMKKNAKANVIIHPETKEILEREHAPIYFAGIHRSFWETTALVVQLNQASTKTPYILMGDNLPFKKTAKKTGIILYERTENKSIREKLVIKKQTQETLKRHWLRNDDIIIFAGGGRAYDGIAKPFGKLGFEAAKEVSKEQEIYIVPFVVDYHSFRDNELETFIQYALGKDGGAQRLTFSDWINFTQKMDTTYTRLGAPIPVTTEINIVELTQKSYNEALNLTKILPENVLALARQRAYSSILFKSEKINLEEVLKMLEPHKNLCELNNEKFWSAEQILEESKAPFKYPSKEDYAWSTHFVNLVKHQYEKINLI